jgi:hypothetical protein
MDGDTRPAIPSFSVGQDRTPLPPMQLATRFPDFLVISPPKTGSTWIAANLRCHPRLFLPQSKEIKYFSSLFQWLDLSWYLDQFSAGIGRLKGEASPSYALLPTDRIRLLRTLRPDLKLIFLMREPISRAWSHAKHCHRFQEANFASCKAPFEAISENQWRENFSHDWPLAGGDYLGQLRRWLSVFPREQVYIGFYEDLARRPESLLRDLLAFLEVEANVDLSDYPVRERVFSGPPGSLSPTLEPSLRGLLAARSRETAAFVREHFGLQTPAEWQAALQTQGAEGRGSTHAVFQRDLDEEFLAKVLQHEGTSSRSQYPIVDGYGGFNIVFYRERFYALAQCLGEVRLAEIDEAERERHDRNRHCFVTTSLEEAKQRIAQQFFQQVEDYMRCLEAGQNDSRAIIRTEAGKLTEQMRTDCERIRRLEVAQGEAFDVLRALESDTLRLSPRELAWIHGFRRALRLPRDGWHRLRDCFARWFRRPAEPERTVGHQAHNRSFQIWK